MTHENPHDILMLRVGRFWQGGLGETALPKLAAA
jgi:hypothetical protein